VEDTDFLGLLDDHVRNGPHEIRSHLAALMPPVVKPSSRRQRLGLPGRNGWNLL
jgi:hypothetical protein